MNDAATDIGSVVHDRKFYFNFFLLEVLAISVFLISIWNVGIVSGFSDMKSELCDWSAAFSLIGTDTANSLPLSSDSGAYSFVLASLLAVFGAGSAAYRAAIVLNGLFATGSFILSYLTARKIFGDADKYLTMAACMCTALYPAFIVNAEIASRETFLIFTVWLSIFLFSRLYYGQRLWIFVISSLSTALCCLIDSRSAGIVLAALLTILTMKFTKKISLVQFITYISVLCGTLLLGFLVRFIIFSGGTESVVSGNVKFLFSPDGIKSFFAVLSGQLFYLGSVSFGIVFVGLIFVFLIFREGASRFFTRHVRKLPADEVTYEQHFSIFLFLSVSFTLISSVVSCIRPESWDELIYGRINEIIVAPLFLFGLLFLFTDMEKKLVPLIISVSAVGITGIILGFSVKAFPSLKAFDVLCASGFRFFYSKFGISPLRIFLIVLVSCAVLFAFTVLCKKRHVLISLVPICAIAVFFVLNGKSVTNDKILSVQAANAELSSSLTYAEETYMLPVYCLSDSGSELAAKTQLVIGDIPLTCVSKSDLLSADGGKNILVSDLSEDYGFLTETYIIIYRGNDFILWLKK